MDSLIQQQRQYLKTDIAFNELYTDNIKALSHQHWTPLRVARLAADFLTSRPPAKVLDIGSGCGKFCLAGACYAPRHRFYGIEQRQYIVEEAKIAQEKIGVLNVSFMHGNFTQLDLRRFDHFYFLIPFTRTSMMKAG